MALLVDEEKGHWLNSIPCLRYSFSMVSKNAPIQFKTRLSVILTSGSVPSPEALVKDDFQTTSESSASVSYLVCLK